MVAAGLMPKTLQMPSVLAQHVNIDKCLQGGMHWASRQPEKQHQEVCFTDRALSACVLGSMRLGLWARGFSMLPSICFEPQAMQGLPMLPT